VLRAGRDYHVLLAVGSAPSHEFSGTFQDLVQHLGRPNEQYTDVSFDPSALDDPLLAKVFEANVADTVQFFLRAAGRQAQVLALDENGALFVDRVPFHSQQSLMHQFGQFFDAVGLRQSASDTLPSVGPSLSTATFTEALKTLRGGKGRARGPRLRFHRVTRSADGDYAFDELQYSRPTTRGSYFDVQVIGDTVNGEAIFTLYCNGEEFSTQVHGSAVFDAVMEHIVAHRHGENRDYPVYITDIDLSRLTIEDAWEGRLHTGHYLNYKRQIERRLNAALARHASGQAPRAASG